MQSMAKAPPWTLIYRMYRQYLPSWSACCGALSVSACCAAGGATLLIAFLYLLGLWSEAVDALLFRAPYISFLYFIREFSRCVDALLLRV